MVHERSVDFHIAGRFPAIKYRVKRFDAYFDKLVKISRSDQGSAAAAITDIPGFETL